MQIAPGASFGDLVRIINPATGGLGQLAPSAPPPSFVVLNLQPGGVWVQDQTVALNYEVQQGSYTDVISFQGLGPAYPPGTLYYALFRGGVSVPVSAANPQGYLVGDFRSVMFQVPPVDAAALTIAATIANSLNPRPNEVQFSLLGINGTDNMHFQVASANPGSDQRGTLADYVGYGNAAGRPQAAVYIDPFACGILLSSVTAVAGQPGVYDLVTTTPFPAGVAVAAPGLPAVNGRVVG